MRKGEKCQRGGRFLGAPGRGDQRNTAKAGTKGIEEVAFNRLFRRALRQTISQ